MNIFATDICPILSAHNLDNRRMLKMIIESAQLLSTAIFLKSHTVYNDIYKPTHQKHPCTIWTSLNKHNWNWLFMHFQALCQEYTFRYHRKHKTAALLSTLTKYDQYIPQSRAMTPFANCTKSQILQIDYTHIENIYEAYQKYLTAKWNHDSIAPQWSKRSPPSWFIVLR